MRRQERRRRPSPSFSRQKAESLFKAQLPCLGCHRLNGEGGTIGPDLTTVRYRRSPDYIAAMIADPQRVVPGSAMPRTLMPESTRELVTRYLVTQGAEGARGAEGAVPARPTAPTAPVNGADALREVVRSVSWRDGER
jgi:cytochrome c2